MPHIVFQAGELQGDVKKELMIALTKTASRITHIPESSFNVLIQENPLENWCIGGTNLVDLLKSTEH